MNVLKNNITEPKVMLIDDNAGESIILNAALKRTNIDNIELEVYQNPLKAIKQIKELLKNDEGKQNLPDLIFLDLNMPEMNGAEVLKTLKKIEDLRYIPIIIVTTSTLDHEISNCYKLHANAVMTKPMDFDDYVNMLEITLKYWLFVGHLPS